MIYLNLDLTPIHRIKGLTPSIRNSSPGPLQNELFFDHDIGVEIDFTAKKTEDSDRATFWNHLGRLVKYAFTANANKGNAKPSPHRVIQDLPSRILQSILKTPPAPNAFAFFSLYPSSPIPVT